MERNLKPVSSSTAPGYPARAPRRRGVGLWLRRAAAAASAALAFGGCYASTETPAEEQLPTGVEEPGAPVEGPAAPELSTLFHPMGLTWPTEPTGVAECEPFEYRLSGDVAPIQTFVCAPTAPAEGERYELPVYIAGGSTCAEDTAWARLVVVEQARVRANLWSDRVDLGLISPAGVLVAELGPESPCLELTMSPGEWTLAATPVDPEVEGNSYFEFAIDEVVRED